MTLTHVTGRGAQRGVRTGGRGTTTYEVDMLPKVKLELVVSDANTQKAIDTILAEARTGNIGDGKIFVMPVAEAIRVRTGEKGDEAL